MAHPSETAAMIVVLVVALIGATLALVAYRATRRSGNRRLWYVAAAFGTLALKGLVVAYALRSETIHHADLELISALFDLAVISLLALPLLK